MAERVGFVPDEPAFLNDLGRIGTARNCQIHEKPEYQVQKTGTAQSSIWPQLAPRALCPAVRLRCGTSTSRLSPLFRRIVTFMGFRRVTLRQPQGRVSGDAALAAHELVQLVRVDIPSALAAAACVISSGFRNSFEQDLVPGEWPGPAGRGVARDAVSGSPRSRRRCASVSLPPER